MTGYANDDEFWESSDRLRYIRDDARHARVAPWALLDCVLALVSVTVPPNVTIPAFVGGKEGSLNCFVAVVGGSGDGKGLAYGEARRLVPNLLEATTALPASGEGLSALFAVREQSPGDEGERRGSILKCANPRALLNVPEIQTLGACMGRTGSTLLGTLTSIWSGESIGGFNRNELNRLRVPEYGYRLAMITGVQPANADTLAREDGTGLPQRFLWCSTADPAAPDTRPEPPQGEFGFDPERLADLTPTPLLLNELYQNGDRWRMRNEDGTDRYPLTPLRYPSTVRDEVDRDAVRRLRRTRPLGLDSHALLLTINVAGLLAIMEQRPGRELEVSEDDWTRAKYIVERSREFRELCLKESRSERRGKRRDALADEIVAKDEAQEMADYTRYANRISVQLRNRDEGHAGITGTELKRYTGLLAHDVYPAIERMFGEGRLEKVGADTGRTQSQLWALPAGVPAHAQV
ncbi:DUF3987 domain-containing protein [Bifidobacterium vespertilionis]|uniref:DUF3987 domain-containing protein n=1 Tax=Bifidobacterium vespertilionis TaxID=2562524 RepID=UPI001BDDAC69|nr:DUF3987 domain-containing protein [Bifidobacterium vespertilionis]